MNFNKEDKIEIIENAISWIVVLALFIYGGGKLIQFDGAADIDKTVSELTGMELMWAFYGYSKSFAMTLGILEMIGGILKSKIKSPGPRMTIFLDSVFWLGP